MNWINIIEEVISIVEDELSNYSLSSQYIADEVCVSEYHLSRSFQILTRYTISEYIRNRRLSVAAEQIKTLGVSVINAAHNVGYESPEAFSKAFKRFHGVNPSECKNSDLKEFFPLQIKISLTQVRPLCFHIEEKDEFFLSGSTKIVPSIDSNATAYLWAQCEMNGYLDTCKEFIGYETLVGVSTPEGYTVKAKCNRFSSDTSQIIPCHKWAVFKCEGTGPQAILTTWDQIYSTWIPKTHHDIVNLPQLEIYYIDNGEYTCDIWIAIK